MERVALVKDFLRVFRLAAVHIILEFLHIVLHSHVIRTNWTNEKDLGSCQKATLFRKAEALDRQNTAAHSPCPALSSSD